MIAISGKPMGLKPLHELPLSVDEYNCKRPVNQVPLSTRLGSSGAMSSADCVRSSPVCAGWNVAPLSSDLNSNPLGRDANSRFVWNGSNFAGPVRSFGANTTFQGAP